jgi:D-3-phosphoglycerate dehydrogenase
MRVLVADKFEKSGLEGIKALGVELVSLPDAGAEGIPAAIQEHKPDVLVVRSTKVPAGTIAKASWAGGGVKLIIRAGAGVDNIDTAAATAAKIHVCNCPGMNSVAVAELTMGLLLACDRRIAEQTADSRGGKWNKKEYSKSRGLKGMTLGVVGCGAIGMSVIKRAIAFEMRVLAWSRSITPEMARQLGAEFGGRDTPSLHDMAARCDAVTIHLPLAPDTKGLIGANFFERMKPGSYFINTSRGDVVDEASLRAAISAKNLRAGLDVYANAPAATEGTWENETVKLPGVVSTHHIGASTNQAQEAVAAETVRIIDVFARTGRAENCVNFRED